MISRALVIIIEACPNFRGLKLGAVSVSIASQRQLMSAIGDLRHLAELQPAHRSASLHPSAFLKAAPALHSLRLLQVSFTFDEDDSSALPALLCCNLAKIVLSLTWCTMSDIAVVLEALASQASHLSLFIMQARGGDDDCTEPANRNKFNEILLPFIIQSDVFQLLISETKNHPERRHLLDWPPCQGGVCLLIDDAPAQEFFSIWLMGKVEACLSHAKHTIPRVRAGAGPTRRQRAWARRGDAWTASHAAELEAILGDQIELVWE